MQNFSRSFLFLLVLKILFFSSCKPSVFSQLRPETQNFLHQQEQARCACLDQYGQDFLRNINTGIIYINSLSEQYNLDSLSVSEHYQIKVGLATAESVIKTVSTCIAQKMPEMDQLTGMLIQEDLRVVLELDPTLSPQERNKRLNQPGLELLEELCPQHVEAVQRLQVLIEAATILPKELQ